jgi:hypothetical protein
MPGSERDEAVVRSSCARVGAGARSRYVQRLDLLTQSISSTHRHLGRRRREMNLVQSCSSPSLSSTRLEPRTRSEHGRLKLTMSGQQGGTKQVAQRKITKKGLFAKDCKYQPRPLSLDRD